MGRNGLEVKRYVLRTARSDRADVLGHEVDDAGDDDHREDGDGNRALGLGGLFTEYGGQFEPDEHQDRKEQTLEDRTAGGDVVGLEDREVVARDAALEMTTIDKVMNGMIDSATTVNCARTENVILIR